MALIVVVNPDSSLAGFRLRWSSFLQNQYICSKHHVKTVLFDDDYSKLRLVKGLEKKIFNIERLKPWYLKLRTHLRSVNVVKADLAVFGKPYGPKHMEAMKIAKKNHTIILSDFCDFHSGLDDTFLEAARLSDIITVPTDALASRILAETSKCPIVIPDKLDYCVLTQNPFFDIQQSKLQAKSILWYGFAFWNNQPSFSFLEFCRVVSSSSDVIWDHRLDVDIISEAPEQAGTYLSCRLGLGSKIKINSYQWSPNIMRQSLSIPGFVILSYPEPLKACEKSANKIELSLCSGKVVISNGLDLPSLDKALSCWVKPMPAGSLQPEDLVFVPSHQSFQAIETLRYLDSKCNLINSLWLEVTNKALA